MLYEVNHGLSDKISSVMSHFCRNHCSFSPISINSYLVLKLLRRQKKTLPNAIIKTVTPCHYIYEVFYMLETGIKAPDFELEDQNGILHKLSDYRGKKVILYFYPKDNTPGCTKQACGFSERLPQIRSKGAVVLGVSKDSVASHKKFEANHRLAFTLLSDPEKKVIQAYDVWKEKKNYGKVSMGVVRTTYLIDEKGIIVMANDKVKAAEDPENMLGRL